MVLFRSIQIHSDPFRSIWIHSDLFGSIHTHWDTFVPIWIYSYPLDPFVLTCTHSKPFRPTIWIHSDPFGSIWTHSSKLQISMNNFGPFFDLLGSFLNNNKNDHFLSYPQLNHNSTQNLGLTWKWIYTTTTTHRRKLNVIDISAAPDPILTKLER